MVQVVRTADVLPQDRYEQLRIRQKAGIFLRLRKCAVRFARNKSGDLVFCPVFAAPGNEVLQQLGKGNGCSRYFRRFTSLVTVVRRTGTHPECGRAKGSLLAATVPGLPGSAVRGRRWPGKFGRSGNGPSGWGGPARAACVSQPASVMEANSPKGVGRKQKRLIYFRRVIVSFSDSLPAWKPCFSMTWQDPGVARYKAARKK